MGFDALKRPQSGDWIAVFRAPAIAFFAGVFGCAQVAERLMAADCKSAAPCELRRFESSPVHHRF